MFHTLKISYLDKSDSILSISVYWETAVSKAMAIEGVLDAFYFSDVPLCFVPSAMANCIFSA